MNLQTEKNRIEKAQKILDCIESANNRIRVYKETHAFFNDLCNISNRFYSNVNRTIESVEATKRAITKLEKYYLKTISKGIDFTKDLPE